MNINENIILICIFVYTYLYIFELSKVTELLSHCLRICEHNFPNEVL